MTSKTLDPKLRGDALLEALESGEGRAASPSPNGWVVHAEVKAAILDLFREHDIVDMPGGFRDKAPLRVRTFDEASRVRLVPGGSAVRRGAHLGHGVVCMPPMYVNIGAFVGEGSMIDSHALVGTCAQIGAGVHLSAAAQIGGVLEPAGASPVIVEDGAFIGGGTGVYEGVRVGARAVLAAGVILTATTPVFDLMNERELRGTSDEPLVIPPDAVVVPGTRPAGGDFARERGLSLSCAVIVKYRDARTDAATALEDALR